MCACTVWEATLNNPDISPSQITVRDYFLKWQEERETVCDVETRKKRNLSHTTLVNDRRVIEKIAGYFGDKKLVDITEQDVEDYLNYHACGDGKKKPGKNTQNKHWLKLKQVLAKAVQENLIRKNPANKDNEPLTEDVKVSDYFDVDEMKQLFAAIEGDPIKIAVYLHFFGVLRREEVCGLDWESVDMTRRQFSVEQVYKQFSHPQMGKTLILNKLTKTSATKRIQPIADALFNLLDTIPEAKRSGPICLGIDGKRMDLDYLTKHFAFILKNNGLKHIRLHELRHSAITLMLMNGVIEITVKKLAGHKVYGTTGHHYTVIDIDEKRKGIAVLNRLFSDSDA